MHKASKQVTLIVLGVQTRGSEVDWGIEMGAKPFWSQKVASIRAFREQPSSIRGNESYRNSSIGWQLTSESLCSEWRVCFLFYHVSVCWLFSRVNLLMFLNFIIVFCRVNCLVRCFVLCLLVLHCSNSCIFTLPKIVTKLINVHYRSQIN